MTSKENQAKQDTTRNDVYYCPECGARLVKEEPENQAFQSREHVINRKTSSQEIPEWEDVDGEISTGYELEDLTDADDVVAKEDEAVQDELAKADQTQVVAFDDELQASDDLYQAFELAESPQASSEEKEQESEENKAKDLAKSRQTQSKPHATKKTGRRFGMMSAMTFLSAILVAVMSFLSGFFGQESYVSTVYSFDGLVKSAQEFLGQASQSQALSPSEIAAVTNVQDFTQALRIVMFVGFAFLALSILWTLLKRPFLSFLSSILSVLTYGLNAGAMVYVLIHLQTQLGSLMKPLLTEFGFSGLTWLHYALLISLIAWLLFSFIAIFTGKVKEK